MDKEKTLSKCITHSYIKIGFNEAHENLSLVIIFNITKRIEPLSKLNIIFIEIIKARGIIGSTA